MKKILTAVISAAICAAFALNTFAVSYSYGDVNGDGKVNSSDALAVLKSSTGIITLSSAQKTAADVNGDGAVNVIDAMLIARYAAKKISVFPVQTSV